MSKERPTDDAAGENEGITSPEIDVNELNGCLFGCMATTTLDDPFAATITCASKCSISSLLDDVEF